MHVRIRMGRAYHQAQWRYTFVEASAGSRYSDLHCWGGEQELGSAAGWSEGFCVSLEMSVLKTWVSCGTVGKVLP
ncbi:hypothetical protein SKAU_G00299840 [Synaphobranchus kaupii]|uniref:Uncharacterized protein n=1 Tax=Synaphobranchus kaupii TaxID=118154 RepID=A0A9Q1IN67_SYNKA|nr:hypothetical protein SKAU_G00299840 [Synaphobranchus kaupii]